MFLGSYCWKRLVSLSIVCHRCDSDKLPALCRQPSCISCAAGNRVACNDVEQLELFLFAINAKLARRSEDMWKVDTEARDSADRKWIDCASDWSRSEWWRRSKSENFGKMDIAGGTDCSPHGDLRRVDVSCSPASLPQQKLLPMSGAAGSMVRSERWPRPPLIIVTSLTHCTHTFAFAVVLLLFHQIFRSVHHCVIFLHSLAHRLVSFYRRALLLPCHSFKPRVPSRPNTMPSFLWRIAPALLSHLLLWPRFTTASKHDDDEGLFRFISVCQAYAMLSRWDTNA